MSNSDILLLSETKKQKLTREQICTINMGFQGVVIHQTTYPQVPNLNWWPSAITSFPNEVESICAQLKAAGFTHEFVPLMWDYGEEGQPYGTGQIIPPSDLSGNLSLYCSYIDRVLNSGIIPVYILPGEGQSGLAWINSDEFPKVVSALGDRKHYGPFWFGYDGTWPANWSVSQVKQVFPRIRSVIGDDAYFGIMFGCGPAGNPYFYVEDESDYSKSWMQCIDIIMMTEGPDQVQCPSLVNGMQYLTRISPFGLCRPDWILQNPLTTPGTPRGPYFTGVIEWHTYDWVRGNVSQLTIQADRDRMRAVGIKCLG